MTGMDMGASDIFDELGTLGIEEEFYIVDDDGHPVSGTDELVYETTPPELLDGRLDHELFKFVIETQTPIIGSIDDAPAVLSEVRSALVSHAEAHGYRIAAAGLHPTAKWRQLEHAEKPRYRAQLDRIQYPQHRNITAGLHIHVGVDDPEKAVWVANELRWYLPPLLAISANSPYWYGFDTGLASARATIFECLPNTGVPTAFESLSEYRRFERAMVETNAIGDRGELWYDVRPHTSLGTVEVRVPDAQAEEGRVMALVEFVHALVLDLAASFEAGADGTRPRREILDENKWRAIRHGRDATFLTRDLDGTESLESIVTRLADRLDVEGIRELLDAEGGADRQRRLVSEHGFDTLRRSIRVQ